MEALAKLSSLSLFGTGLSQHARLVTLASSQDRALPESLIAEKFSGREAVNELFAFDLDALSVSTDLDLNLFIGEELSIALLQPDGSRRAWHGLCTQASWLGADGGVARYRLHLEPALALLRHRRDSYIFQDRNAQEIVTELLTDYPQVRFEFDVTQQLTQRAVCTQYRESDFEFLTRLLASEGLSWRFEHDQAAGDETGSDGQAKHRVVIFDSKAKAPATPGGDVIRFHGVRATDTDDAIDEFRARRQVQANAVSISSWDPLQLLAPAAEHASNLDAGELPALALYDGSGERIATSSGVADPHSALMLQALELENKQFAGAGAVRRLAAGHTFALTQHERYPDGAFTVLSVEHEARNNFQSQIATTSDALQGGTYRNTFTCVRDVVAILPPAMAARQASTALGPQAALVVGTGDAISTTTRDHQVKVQFAWQRGQDANAGGMAHNTDAKGDAPGDETSGTWVRVAEALAGPNWGSQFTPRLGTEVLVDFIEGDMDRPVVVAQLYSGQDGPPFAAGVNAGVNHAGVLSGIHSHNFDGGGFNQWQLDDTPGQLRTRLATSTAATQLNLGYLIAQAPASAHRGAYRGSGFELRTDAWGVVRGGEGVLLSTTGRYQNGSGVVSTQLDVAEAVSRTKGAQDLGACLGEAAAQQRALFSKDAAKAQAAFIDQIDPEAQGKHGVAVNGQEASKAKDGERELDPAKPVEKFAKPIVLMEAPSNINWATPASTVIFAGEHVNWSSQSDLHLAAAHTVSSVAANAVSLFTHAGGIQAIAGNGPVSLQAHTDQLEILADKAITVISVNDSIQINAREKIVLQAGQSSITLEGGNITFACTGNFTVKGGQHLFDAGARQAAVLGKLPDSRLKLFDEAFILKDKLTGAVLAYQVYRIKRADGSFEDGVTDEAGHTHVVRGAEAERIEIDLEPQGALPPAFDEQIQFKNANAALLANVKYQLKLGDGTVVDGVTDAQGMTSRIPADKQQAIVEATLQASAFGSCCGGAKQAPDMLTVDLQGVTVNDVKVGSSVAVVQTPEGKSRGLTPGEISMAQSIFGMSIDYAKVKVHNGEYLWFGLQPDDTAMTPNGEIYFNPARYLTDFSETEYEGMIWFIHEMAHVWQYQLGYPVKLRGALRLGLSYKYALDGDTTLADFNMEAQGNVLADYWAMKKYGANVPWIHEEQYKDDFVLFEKVLKTFIANPGDKTNLPGG
ncbi:type VI secretion system Vgr family protein [Massilia sp. TSP1-1-2]|uniref:type VI secretion system Vgr family protein n=1 Tax=Massilia sp. TSP1-1-2 TaxID=2804649 RepID=UPI003CE80A20